MSDYTRLGVDIWSWEPWVRRSMAGRLVYLALYSSAPIKRTCPGLLHGDIATLVDASKLPIDDAANGLEDLLTAGLAEYDRAHRVMRLTELPDCWERPDNANVLRGYWNGFRTVPACAVRDAHIPIIRQLIDGHPKGASAGQEAVWAETFATVEARARRKRGVQTVTQRGPETLRQADLFGPAPLAVVETVPGTVSETVPGTVWDPGSGIRDPGSGRAAAVEPEAGPAETPVIRHPSAMPFTLADLFRVLQEHSRGRFAAGVWDQRLAKPITDAIKACGAAGVTLEDIEHGARWLAGGGMAWRGTLGPPWVAKAGELVNLVNQARDAARGPTPGAQRRPAPSAPGGFGTGGRRQL